MQNPESLCDLHLHSYYSDGVLSPEELVRRSAKASLSAISITDHDTVDGVGEALDSAGSGMTEVITGVEFNVSEKGESVHILGYLFDHTDPDLVNLMDRLKEARRSRAESIIEKLSGEGIDISMDEVRDLSGKGTIGRLHIARLLFEKGYVSEIREGFSKYIGKGRPCYVPRMRLRSAETVDLIKKAGGVAVWAHPGALIRNKLLLKALLDSGISGLEAFHPNHDSGMSDEIISVARENSLVITGGSDYHFDEAMKAYIGEIGTAYKSVIDLRKMI